MPVKMIRRDIQDGGNPRLELLNGLQLKAGNFQHQQTVRIESAVKILKVEEAANGRARSGKQNHRKHDLHHHQPRQRAMQPTIGNVRIDGAKLTDWDQNELGKYFGYMPQESSLFEGTIKDNIARFEKGSSADEAKRIDEAVVEAAKEAGIHELILQLPKGYDTQLGLMGFGLSAGQAQRVALARALYGEPRLIVLDEPNAFLDQSGETALVTAIAKARARGATVIVIAHRRGVLSAVDRLLVLEDGRPKLWGPANEVVARLTGPRKSENAA